MKTESFQVTNITTEEFCDLVSDAIGKAIQLQLNFEPEPRTVNFLTREETASRLRVSLPTLHEYTKTGKVRGHKIGGRVLYREDEINASLIEIESLKSSRE